MKRKTVITGAGVVSGLGIGIEQLWNGLCEGRSAIRPVESFDASAFDAQIAAEVPDFKIRDFVPKKARKSTKVMCRDIELAVAAADLAARDAKLNTPGIDPDSPRSYPGERTGCHIGAGLITADLLELTSALFNSADEQTRRFDIHHWGREGMKNLTPLWLLKYLPNMLACHVTIIHDLQGPSNTLTCCEASGGLSVAESMRVIERGAAEACFCGGAENKMHPMTFYRQIDAGRITTDSNDRPEQAVRPFDRKASGSVAGEG
ncbi:MAG: beta-ketoacyl synthase N-terminal-like domain-containing protein, partial [Phycisphaeraceae bacterium]|nr:beta-ketoacyl synthase N-terminal-like domain-containing protein [Phycisphaeraceae bacterium]